MPDITMCLNNECSKNNNCYRYTAIPKKQNQSYTRFPSTPNGCGLFMNKNPYKEPENEITNS